MPPKLKNSYRHNYLTVTELVKGALNHYLWKPRNAFEVYFRMFYQHDQIVPLAKSTSLRSVQAELLAIKLPRRCAFATYSMRRTAKAMVGWGLPKALHLLNSPLRVVRIRFYTLT